MSRRWERRSNKNKEELGNDEKRQKKRTHHNYCPYVNFEIPLAATMRTTVLWYVTPCSLVA